MYKAITIESEIPAVGQIEMDSKYRMIIVAAQRSKQLQRGSRPRVENGRATSQVHAHRA